MNLFFTGKKNKTGEKKTSRVFTGWAGPDPGHPGPKTPKKFPGASRRNFMFLPWLDPNFPGNS